MSSELLLNDLLLRQDTWRGHNRSIRKHVVSTGNDHLDRFLLGGWPVSALTELSTRQHGIGELSLLLPVLKSYAHKEQLCVWLDPPYQPYAPSLVAANIPLDKLLIVRSKNAKEWLWAAEQVIRGKALLFAWANQINPNYAALRKLQLAAADSFSPAFLFRGNATLNTPSPAILRIELEGIKTNVVSLMLHKLKGKMPGAKINISLGDEALERIPLEKLPVNICYPKSVKESESQHLNA